MVSGAPRDRPVGVVLALSPQERDELAVGLGSLCAPRLSEPLDSEQVISNAQQAAALLPTRVATALHSFREPGNRHGGLLVRNLPLDAPLPPTPADGYLGHWGRVPLATFAQLAVTAALGDVIAYADEKAGHLLQDVVPVDGAQRRQENSGTVYLELHTEDGFHPHKPDFVSLLCLRPDPENTGTTVVGSIHDALPKLSASCVELLRQPLYVLDVSSSFTGAQDVVSAPAPVLRGSVDRPTLVADFHATHPIGEPASVAFAELKAALVSVLCSARLRAGDLVVIDNRHAVHGRTAFAARYDGHDRWLRRSLAVTDLARTCGGTPPASRVLRPLTELIGEAG